MSGYKHFRNNKDSGATLFVTTTVLDFDHQRGLNRRQFWKYSYRSVLIEGEEMFWQKMNYMHQNPVRAGYVQQPEDYRWSSARFVLRGCWSEEAGLPYNDVMESLGTWRAERTNGRTIRAEA